MGMLKFRWGYVAPVLLSGIAGGDACSENREGKGYERRLREGRRPTSILEALGLWGRGGAEYSS